MALQPEGGDPVWVGDWALLPDQQGLVVLGTLLGTDAFVQRQLRIKHVARDRLLERIPHVEDPQASRLLLRCYCAAPRANYLLHVLPPLVTTELSHGAWPGFSARRTPRCQKTPQVQPNLRRGLGDLACVRCARADCHAAHWASWCDALPVVCDRARQVAQRILQALCDPETEQTPCVRKALKSRPGKPLLVWLLLLSQAGRHSPRALNVLPTHDEVVIPSPQFRVLLLRRLRLPLPPAPTHCHCRGQLDPLGDHRAACASAGVLPARVIPLERRWPVFAASRGPESGRHEHRCPRAKRQAHRCRVQWLISAACC